MKTKKIVIIAMLIALCTVGAFIKIPSPVATVSFDSLPGFVAAGLLTPVIGGFVGAAGHLISGLINGFPLGIVSHLVIAATMFFTMLAFGYFFKKGTVLTKVISIVVAVLINGPIGLIPFMFLINPGFFIIMVLPLCIAALVNVLLATFILPSLQRILKLDMQTHDPKSILDKDL